MGEHGGDKALCASGVVEPSATTKVKVTLVCLRDTWHKGSNVFLFPGPVFVLVEVDGRSRHETASGTLPTGGRHVRDRTCPTGSRGVRKVRPPSRRTCRSRRRSRRARFVGTGLACSSTGAGRSGRFGEGGQRVNLVRGRRRVCKVSPVSLRFGRVPNPLARRPSGHQSFEVLQKGRDSCKIFNELGTSSDQVRKPRADLTR